MKKEERFLSNELKNKLIDSFIQDDSGEFSVYKSKLIMLNDELFVPDLIIQKKGKPFVIIEFSIFDNKYTLEEKKKYIYTLVNGKQARFGIITNNDTFKLYDRYKPKDGFYELEFDTIIELILNAKDFEVTKTHIDVIKWFFEAAIQNELVNSNDTEMLNLINTKSFSRSIGFSDKHNSFMFIDGKKGLDSIENKLFRLLIGDFTEKRICRYTSLDTLYSMLNNSSFRMSGLAGMNDMTEVNYADNYINGKNRKLIELHNSSVRAINRRYITSCTNIENKDKLTMWRLYADDAKGVCLEFVIYPERLNKHVLLNKVKYAHEQGHQNELDMLKSVREQIEYRFGFSFRFNELKYYRHFFKPTGYKEEEEIRLLVVDNDKLKGKEGWVKTHSHSIFNPVIDFDLNSPEFPLKLTEITLGPKCPEMEINKVQIEEMLRRKRAEIKLEGGSSNLEGIKVSLSSIKDYR